MDWGKRIGANLKQLRTERNLTLGQLSGLAGISRGWEIPPSTPFGKLPMD